MARVQAHHATGSRVAPGYVATSSARVDIWIRTTGTRRQAFYRCPAAGIAAWKAMGVPLADKALKAGTITLPGIDGAAVRPHEEDAPVHPMAEQFSAQARQLSGEIDALNLSARGAA